MVAPNYYNLLPSDAYYPRPYGGGYEPGVGPALGTYNQVPSTTLQDVAVRTILPEIISKGIDFASGKEVDLGQFGESLLEGFQPQTTASTTFSGLGGSPVPTPTEQMGSLGYQQRSYNAMTPMFQDLMSRSIENFGNVFNAQQANQQPWLMAAKNIADKSADAQQKRASSAAENLYKSRLGMAALANAAKPVPQRAFGRQGVPNL
jgi:hypothetical protein|tara:strand:+ start:5687 stop:6301 length:615 start_codon:yes stop_codon:yes gene_type:complete